MDTRTIAAYAILLALLLLLNCVVELQKGSATDTIFQSKTVSVGETLISAGQIFELGFFSPGNSGKQYVGIWYKQISVRRVVWVANRENPLMITSSTSGLTIGDDGNLLVVDKNHTILWSTNISVSVNQSVAVLLDKGSLVLRDGVSGKSLWESFSHPCDIVLPGMMIGMDTKTGEKLLMSSWKSEDDPSSGKFVAGIATTKPPEAYVLKDSVLYWRSGLWNGLKFVGMPDLHGAYLNGFNFVPQVQNDDQYFFTFTLFNTSYVRLINLTSNGALTFVEWNEGMNEWNTVNNALDSMCDVYGACGPFGICNKNKSPICSCMTGFVPNSDREWNGGNWTSGCVRRSELFCTKSNNNHSSSSGSGKIDGFLKLSAVKLPHLSIYVPLDDEAQCDLWCLNNCSCLAYAYIIGIGCTTWSGDLLDNQQFSLGGEDLFLRLANSELGHGKERAKLIISLTVISGVGFLGAITYGLCKWKANQRGKQKKRNNHFHFSDIFNPTRAGQHGNSRRDMRHQPSELPIFDLEKIVAATKKFSTNNKLGEGGFGPVFKGEMEDGREIAVKKLSRCSGQGIEEFKNEIILISKLQHKNLVQLLGCCIDGEELMIVYEYMPNRSLDTLLFDSKRRAQLDWAKRFNIICGIAKGLVYLHYDSRLKIIHRDLKVSNILLDKDMNPKISDFGLARIFQATQEQANTHRVVGTFGYMSPEYALGGVFSEKSDVFSFGVLLLEIVSGKKNTSFQNHEKHLSLLSYAWQLWNEGRAFDLVDQVLADSFSLSEVMRCIHVGLLCVQDQVADRPTMPAIILMLSSETDGPQPKQPTFTFRSLLDSGLGLQSDNICSMNEDIVSTVYGR